MTSSTLPVLAGLIGTLTGVSATYVVARRRTSGRIGTSEAADLWKASESIRHDLTTEVGSLRTEVAGLRAENHRLSDELDMIRRRLEMR